jgi:hypothetical protein
LKAHAASSWAPSTPPGHAKLLRIMRVVLLVAGLAVLGSVAWKALALASGPSTVQALAQRLGEDPGLVTAEAFASRLEQDLTRAGLVAAHRPVVTMSAAEVYALGQELGVVRSISVSVELERQALFGLVTLTPSKTLVQVRAAVRDGEVHPASHWPDAAARLPLRPLVPHDGDAAPAGEQAGPSAWSTASADGSLIVTSDEQQGLCRLTCEEAVGGQARWSEPGPCLVKRTDLRFVGPDCERLVAITPRPDFRRPWQHAEVAVVLKRAQKDYAVNAGAVIKDYATVERQQGWLRGHSRLEGAPPAYGTDGRVVELTTSEGRVEVIPLVASP